MCNYIINESLKMLNEYTLNGATLNGNGAPLAVSNDDLVFNDYGIQNTNIIVSNFEPDSL